MERKKVLTGVALTISFLIVLSTMFMPIIGGKNFIQYADALFNSLSKGSVYTMPGGILDLKERAPDYVDRELSVELTFEEESLASEVAVLYEEVANVEVVGTTVSISGSLGEIVLAALKDVDATYYGKEDEIKAMEERYGYDAKKAMYYWWLSLEEISDELKREGKFGEALFLHEVVTKAVEPAYNFYGVPIRYVGKEVFLVAGLLTFYIGYTVWWGYSIYFLFEGFGLKATKPKVKKEA